MANLVIDIGNTRTKLAVFEQGKMLIRDEPAAGLTTAIEAAVSGRDCSKAILSSVREDKPELRRWLSLNFEKAVFLDHTTALPFVNHYATPETLGNDRLALVAAAVDKHPGRDILVLDAGTCITYDFVDRRKNYYGGLISPGLNMRLAAMHQFTEGLPRVEWDPDLFQAAISSAGDEVSGDSTHHAMLMGAGLGALCETEGIINRYGDRYGELDVMLTGGDAVFFSSNLKRRIFAHPNLVLEGLDALLRYVTHDME